MLRESAWFFVQDFTKLRSRLAFFASRFILSFSHSLSFFLSFDKTTRNRPFIARGE